MNNILKKSPQTLHDHMMKELDALKKIVSYLWDGNNEAFHAIHFIKGNYKEWPAMLVWLKRNDIKGQKLVDFFKNESTDDGGGYHMGATYILSKIKGHKNVIVGVKIDELI